MTDIANVPAPIDAYIDFETAAACVERLVPAGPSVPRDVAQQAVLELRRHAAASVDAVAEVTGASCPKGPDALVVDRATWARLNVASFRVMLSPAMERAMKRRPEPHPVSAAITRRITGVEVGAVLSYLGGRVLGQYDPYGSSAGTLMLVAPNIVMMEQRLGVDPHDFRLWVCVHEETHRWQFGTAPWLREHINERVTSLIDGTLGSPSEVAERLRRAVTSFPQAIRGGRASVLDLLQTPEQREELASITAIMSLLEGHADVVMDAVGEDVIPTVKDIRAAFGDYRKNPRPVETFWRRSFGMDAKLRQYSEGARFVRLVLEATDMATFNRVWECPENLPTAREIADPQAWVGRVVDAPSPRG